MPLARPGTALRWMLSCYIPTRAFRSLGETPTVYSNWKKNRKRKKPKRRDWKEKRRGRRKIYLIRQRAFPKPRNHCSHFGPTQLRDNEAPRRHYNASLLAARTARKKKIGLIFAEHAQNLQWSSHDALEMTKLRLIPTLCLQAILLTLIYNFFFLFYKVILGWL